MYSVGTVVLHYLTLRPIVSKAPQPACSPDWSMAKVPYSIPYHRAYLALLSYVTTVTSTIDEHHPGRHIIVL